MLGKTISEIRAMSNLEFVGWVRYIAWKNIEEKKAAKRAKNKSKRK